MSVSREIALFFQTERFATEKELLRMTQLTADSSKVFPPDFAAIVSQEIVTKVKSVLSNFVFKYSIILLITCRQMTSYSKP